MPSFMDLYSYLQKRVVRVVIAAPRTAVLHCITLLSEATHLSALEHGSLGHNGGPWVVSINHLRGHIAMLATNAQSPMFKWKATGLALSRCINVKTVFRRVDGLVNALAISRWVSVQVSIFKGQIDRQVDSHYQGEIATSSGLTASRWINAQASVFKPLPTQSTSMESIEFKYTAKQWIVLPSI
ncbi:hypothetical protein sscle_05g043160 [Sclerotinia sclerotiorum 1980 UF-70]|uniref:Uncharacterized protein n=1 Tax=Sclerotinia sclerotiorum (strain ATCC 18683 / 1980 / Ss-1) TaxID=665079 RepID=A0A1D9Q3S3_SCLS1|nr:hypothetical protein sscle_05g043160 [Sclerotinia sclerotiorum 1980 UF-70]